MNILTVEEMRKSETYTMKQKNITSLDLMESAGTALFNSLTDELIKEEDQICIVCGTGNNGGDAMVVARHLIKAGYKTNIIVVGNPSKITWENKVNLKYLYELKVSVRWLNDNITVEKFKQLLSKSTVVIEGLFGIGLNREIKGHYYKVIDIINKTEIFTISIDIPSGMMENGMVAGICVRADVTFVIEPYKIGNLINDALDYSGKIVTVDIGLMTETDNHIYFIDEDEIQFLKKRKKNSHKYNYGSVLIIGGHVGMTGAPQMSAISAMRTGSGLCTIGINDKYYSHLNQIYPELMVMPFNNINELKYIMNKKDVIAFGPGLGRDDDYNSVLEYLINLNIPLIIDADGIFYLKNLLDKIKTPNNIIITPHYGELAMLLNTTSQDVMKDPLAYIDELTGKYALTIVLKGCCTIIAHKNKRYFSTYGNAGMATAGSGDVLTGIIASLIGQGMEVLEACKTGVFLHSKAGTLAANKLGEMFMIATDIIKCLPQTINKR